MDESSAKQPAVTLMRETHDDLRAKDLHDTSLIPTQGKTKFRLTGLEAINKRVSPSGGCGRIYLPIRWLGKRVKVIRLD